MPRPRDLSAGRIHMWRLPLDGAGAHDFASLDFLDAEERARYLAMGSASARQKFWAGRMLLRAALSCYADLDPRQWRFVRSNDGAPSIAADLNPRKIAFSLAHTKNMTVCAIALEARIGVDVEFIDPMFAASEMESVANNIVFAPQEVARFARQTDAERKEGFFAAWTLKEAYLKARGVGLAAPIDGFWFDLEGGAPKIHFSAPQAVGVAEESSHWRFSTSKPTSEHRLSIACSPPFSDLIDIEALA